MGRVDGKVALITGAAQGQGRSHAVRLAEEGADILALDLCEPIEDVAYHLPGPEDLAETVRQVEATDRRILARIGDVRDPAPLEALVKDGMEEFGRIDIVVANAGIGNASLLWEVDDTTWDTVIGINLTGVFRTIKAAVPALIEGGRGGSIVLISSIAGIKGVWNCGHYGASKHGVVGLGRTLANELGQHNIRVNVINPGNVGTDMLLNDGTYGLFRPELENPSREDAVSVMEQMTLLPIPYLEPIDISNAVLWLCSDEARYVTGITLPVDGGWYART